MILMLAFLWTIAMIHEVHKLCLCLTEGMRGRCLQSKIEATRDSLEEGQW
jgi:hypothetical protein